MTRQKRTGRTRRGGSQCGIWKTNGHFQISLNCVYNEYRLQPTASPYMCSAPYFENRCCEDVILPKTIIFTTQYGIIILESLQENVSITHFIGVEKSWSNLFNPVNFFFVHIWVQIAKFGQTRLLTDLLLVDGFKNRAESPAVAQLPGAGKKILCHRVTAARANAIWRSKR